MKVAELLSGEAGADAGAAALDVTGVTADSRAVKPGYLFAALPGSRADGSRYIAEALQRGASAILVPQGAAQARRTDRAGHGWPLSRGDRRSPLRARDRCR